MCAQAELASVLNAGKHLDEAEDIRWQGGGGAEPPTPDRNRRDGER
jgi:hypothetical protein